GPTVVVAFEGVRTSAQASIVTLAWMEMLKSTRWGLPAAVHVSSALMLAEWCVGPVAAGHAGRSGCAGGGPSGSSPCFEPQAAIADIHSKNRWLRRMATPSA